MNYHETNSDKKLDEKTFVEIFLKNLPKPLLKELFLCNSAIASGSTDMINVEYLGKLDIKIKENNLTIHHESDITSHAETDEKEIALLKEMSAREFAMTCFYHYKLNPNAESTKAYQYFIDKHDKLFLPQHIKDDYLSEKRIAEEFLRLEYKLTYIIPIEKPLTEHYAIELGQQIYKEVK